MKGQKKLWTWRCSFDNWTWEDGLRCLAGSRKPTTKHVAQSGALRHEKANRGHNAIVRTAIAGLLLLLLVSTAAAETPETVTAASAWFCAERVMSSEGAAVDEAAACAFGQVGFGRLGVAGWMLATGTMQQASIDVSRVRVLELAVAAHWYAAQGQGVAVGPSVWVGGSYGYESDGVPLVKREAATWGIGARFGGHGAWGQIGWGTHEMLGPGMVQAIAHLPLGDRSAINADLVTNGSQSQLRLRACVGWR